MIIPKDKFGKDFEVGDYFFLGVREADRANIKVGRIHELYRAAQGHLICCY